MIISTVIYDYSPLPQLQFWVLISAFSIALGYITIRRWLAVVCAFGYTVFCHWAVWWWCHSILGDHHWNQFEAVFYGDLWEYPYYWTYIPLLVFWIFPWFIGWIAHWYWHSYRPSIKEKRVGCCTRCDYDLRGNPDAPSCPECGEPIATVQVNEIKSQ